MALAQPPAVPQAPAMPSWLAGPVRNDAAGPAQLDLLDEIGVWGITAAEFSAALAKVPAGDLTLNISSPGGDVFDGVAILNMLRQRPGQLTVVVTGLAASAASVIAMAASPGKLYMSPNSVLMCHEAWAATIGDEAGHRETADLLGQLSDNIADIYAARSGRPAADMRAMMRAETWYVGQEAVDAGLADAMLPGSESPPADDWTAFVQGLTSTSPAGLGRPGNSALRQRAYGRYTAQTGRGGGTVSPFVAAIFRGRA
jgi:ATP-dependent protease ClpP protease subunit